jgi:hypothetical protein
LPWLPFSRRTQRVEDARERADVMLRLQYWLRATHFEQKLARFIEVTKAGFNPNQPRVPAGNPDGGQWTSDGTSSTRGPPASRGGSDQRVPSGRPSQHHYVPQSVYGQKPLRPETRKVFDEAKTSRLHGGAHGWDKGHRAYNRAVSESLDRFLATRKIRPEDMIADHAREFVREIMQSRDPRIRGYNLKLYMREFQYWLRRGPRRFE